MLLKIKNRHQNQLCWWGVLFQVQLRGGIANQEGVTNRSMSVKVSQTPEHCTAVYYAQRENINLCYWTTLHCIAASSMPGEFARAQH